jgi:hypothetical protein
MPHPHGAVLQIAVVKAKAGIEEDFSTPHFCASSICRAKNSRSIGIGSALKSKSPTSRTFLPAT